MTEQPFIGFAPYMRWGQPTIRNTQIAGGALTIAKAWWYRTHSLEQLAEDWPELTRADLLVTAWYFAAYGGRAWRARWRSWSEQWSNELWHAEWDQVPLPPQNENESQA